MFSEKDRLIVEALKMNSRATIKELSNETGIPRATVFDRMKKLQEEKIIKNFTVELDHEKTGNGTLAFILVKFDPHGRQHQADVGKSIAKIDGVEEVHIIAGDWDMLLKARAKGLKELGELVVDKLRMVEGVSDSVTCPCFKTIK